MIKYLLKHILKTISLILTIIFINILIIIGLFSYIAIDSKYNDDTDPISLGKDIVKGRDLKSWNDYLKEKDIWAFVLDSNGEIIDSSNLPKNIKSSYDLRDIAKFTRYYLEDYPVFTFVKDEGLLVLGYPKGSYDKLPFNYINMKLFPRIIYFIILILVLNIVGLIFIYIKIRKKFMMILFRFKKALIAFLKMKILSFQLKAN